MSQIIEVDQNNLIIEVGCSSSGGSAGVTSLNSLAGSLTLSAGNGIAIDSDGSSILTIRATGSVSGNYATYTELYNSGQYLYGLIQVNSAGVGSINGASGILTFTGAGNVTVSRNGQAFTFSGDVSSLATITNLGLTGSNLYNLIASTSGVLNQTINTTGNLLAQNIAQTGSNLFILLTGSSGVLQSQINTIVSNLGLTGSNLLNQIISLSGYSDSSFYLKSNPQNYATSGNLHNTGTVLSNEITNLSTTLTNNLTNSGQTLLTVIFNSGQSGVFYTNNISGVLNNNLLNSGQTISTNLFNTGQNLIQYVNNASGNLNTKIFNTGQAAITAAVQSANNYSNSISGRVISLNSISGLVNLIGTGTVFITTNGQTIYVSGSGVGGSADVTFADLVNTSGVLYNEIYNTGSYLYSLISASSAGVGSLNGQSGALNITGAGNVRVIVNGQTFTISGNTGDYANFVHRNETGQFADYNSLYNTGQLLNNKIDSLSGFAIDFSGVLSTQITSTGQQNWINSNNNSINLSGNLTQTGIILNDKINSLSGYSDLVFATKVSLDLVSGNIITTGQSLLNIIANTGQQSWSAANNNGINLSGNLYSTGSYLFNLIDGFSVEVTNSINSLSGYSNDTFARITTTNEISGNLITTGQNLLTAIFNTGQTTWQHGQNNATNLSGSLTSSGIILNNKIDTLSGYSNATFARQTTVDIISGNLITTGQSLLTVIFNTGQTNFNHANNNSINLSGNLTQTGITLLSIINSLSGYSNNTFATKLSLDAVSGNLITTGQNLLTIIQSTGQTNWNHSNNNGINLSGQLTATGSVLNNRINILSGIYKSEWINASGIALVVNFDTNVNERNYIFTPTGNFYISGSGYTQGGSVNIFISGDVVTRTMTQSGSQWNWMGAVPSSITAYSHWIIGAISTSNLATGVYTVYTNNI